MPRRLHHEATERVTSKADFPAALRANPTRIISLPEYWCAVVMFETGRRRTAGAMPPGFSLPPFLRKKPSPLSPAEGLATASHFFCFAAPVPLCWSDRHSRQHSPAWFRLVHDGEGEAEVGGAGGGLVEKVGGEEAAAWCQARSWYHLAQSQHEDILFVGFLKGGETKKNCLFSRQDF